MLWKVDSRRDAARGRRLAVIGSLFLVSDIGYSFLLAAFATILLQRGVALETVGLINLLATIYFAGSWWARWWTGSGGNASGTTAAG